MALRPHVAVGLLLSGIDPTPILINHSSRLDRNQVDGGQSPCRQGLEPNQKEVAGAAEAGNFALNRIHPTGQGKRRKWNEIDFPVQTLLQSSIHSIASSTPLG